MEQAREKQPVLLVERPRELAKYPGASVEELRGPLALMPPVSAFK